MYITVYILYIPYIMSCILCESASSLVFNQMNFCVSCYSRQIEDITQYENDHQVIATKPIQVTEKIYIGDKSSAIDESYLRLYNIKGIIVAGKKLRNAMFDGIQYLFLEIDDSLEQDLSVVRKLSKNFFNNINGNILVHCYSGISRSASIVISLLMSQHDMTYKEAHEYLKSKSPRIHPNSNFVEQLSKTC